MPKNRRGLKGGFADASRWWLAWSEAARVFTAVLLVGWVRGFQAPVIFSCTGAGVCSSTDRVFCTRAHRPVLRILACTFSRSPDSSGHFEKL